jgi:hypothetical protein
MSLQTWKETLVTQQAAGTLFNTYTTAKSVINPQAQLVLPAGFWYPGRKVEVHVKGGLSNIVTTPGTVTFQVMFGPTANIIVFTSGAIQLNATAHTTLPFALDIELVCRAVGSGTNANLMGMGYLNGVMFTLTAGQTDNVNTPGQFPVPATAPAVGTGFDSTVAGILDFWTGFSISNAGNGIQVQLYSVESCN